MKKLFLMFAAICCAMALNATSYSCHLKVTINEEVAEQDQVPVMVVKNGGTYTLTLKNFILMAARKTFFQIGFDNKESTDVLDYCVGHARSKRMAMNYAMVKPEMATACMRRVFDIAIGTKTEQTEPNLDETERKTERTAENWDEREQNGERTEGNGEDFTSFLM